jgi:hypothetical protein
VTLDSAEHEPHRHRTAYDHHDLIMLTAALRRGATKRRPVFEVFARHLPHGCH